MRIPDDFLDCVFYLYHSYQHADAGALGGGSGFFVGVPAKRIPNATITFAVTNKHVLDSGADVIRMNTMDGKKVIYETDQRVWIPHPAGDDIAICPITVDATKFRFRWVGLNNFITRDLIIGEQIGPGDEVFVVGRFINHEGKQKNTPSVRFGHLAQMANEPIPRDDRFLQDSFLVEAKSIGGYSGSPVFLYVDGMKPRPGSPGRSTFFKGPWLLGVDWCHLNDWKPVCDGRGRPLGNSQMPPWDMQVGSNTGMMGVIPAWKIAEIFDLEPIKRKIAETEDEALKTLGAPPSTKDAV